jgi:3-methyladenine DNA glycosylase AlkD
MNPIVAEVVQRLTAEANLPRAEAIARERPTADRLLGLPVPLCHALGAEIARRVKGSPPADIDALASALIDTGVYEARTVAIDVLARRRVPLDRAALERLGRGLDNWATVDHFGDLLAGPAWLRGHIGDDDVAAWARSPDRWWRRLALVCTTALNKKSRGGPGDAPRTLAICALFVDERDPMLVKALSWALRALGARDPAAVVAFLEAHPTLPALVRREVRHKLATGKKN